MIEEDVSILNALNINKNDSLLQVGLKIHDVPVKNFSCVRSPREFPENTKYSKIIVKGINVDDFLIRKVCELNCGLAAFFVSSLSQAENLSNKFECDWYPAQSWVFKTNFGFCVLTDAKGKFSFSEQVANW